MQRNPEKLHCPVEDFGREFYLRWEATTHCPVWRSMLEQVPKVNASLRYAGVIALARPEGPAQRLRWLLLLLPAQRLRWLLLLLLPPPCAPGQMFTGVWHDSTVFSDQFPGKFVRVKPGGIRYSRGCAQVACLRW